MSELSTEFARDGILRAVPFRTPRHEEIIAEMQTARKKPRDVSRAVLVAPETRIYNDRVWAAEHKEMLALEALARRRGRNIFRRFRNFLFGEAA